jgi:hypothetical protein
VVQFSEQLRSGVGTPKLSFNITKEVLLVGRKHPSYPRRDYKSYIFLEPPSKE